MNFEFGKLENMKSQLDNGLIWITGYSGAGKTTVSRIVSDKLKEMGGACCFVRWG